MFVPIVRYKHLRKMLEAIQTVLLLRQHLRNPTFHVLVLVSLFDQVGEKKRTVVNIDIKKTVGYNYG